MYYGDIALGDTIDIKFTTRQFTSGAPFTLAGSPVVSAYVGNGTTEITSGITLSVDFDGRTGFNNVRVVASGGNGFAAATNVALVITTGTVDSVSVVGEVISSFSIGARTVALNTQGKSDVNAEVVDCLNVDTYAEPGQEAPPATTTLVKKIGYLYKVLRNRKNQTGTLWELFGDDATTVHQKRTVSDDGTTTDVEEIVTGP